MKGNVRLARIRTLLRWCVLLALTGGILFLYAWTGLLFEYDFLTEDHNHDQKSYNTLVDAWEAGQMNLLFEPPEGISSVGDMWNHKDHHVLRRRFWDIVLYEGKFYLYFGVTPALLLYAPARLLGLGCVNDAFATAIFCSVALMAMLALLRRILHAFEISPPLWMLGFALISLGFGTTVPFLLRTCAVYQVSISCGYACSMVALYFFASGALLARPSLWRLTLGSLALGLAIGGRPTQIVVVPVLIVVSWAILRWSAAQSRELGTHRKRWAWPLAAAWLPFSTIIFLLGLYNYLRFDSWFEFGTTYQITSTRIDVLPQFQPAALLPGLYFYLWQPYITNWEFPFFHARPRYPGTLPQPFFVERIIGLFRQTPFSFILLLFPVLFDRPQQRNPKRQAKTSPDEGQPLEAALTEMPPAEVLSPTAPPDEGQPLEAPLTETPSTTDLSPKVLPVKATPAYGLGLSVGSLAAVGFMGLLLITAAAPCPTATMRYMIDFAPFILLAATVIWFDLDRKLTSVPLLRFTFRIFACLLILQGTAVSLATSLQGYGRARCKEFSAIKEASYVPRRWLAPIALQDQNRRYRYAMTASVTFPDTQEEWGTLASLGQGKTISQIRAYPAGAGIIRIENWYGPSSGTRFKGGTMNVKPGTTYTLEIEMDAIAGVVQVYLQGRRLLYSKRTLTPYDSPTVTIGGASPVPDIEREFWGTIVPQKQKLDL